MKKVIAIVLVIVLLLVLCSCGDANNQQTPSDSIDDIKTTNSTSNLTTTSDATSTNSAHSTTTNSTNTDTTQCTHVWGQWVEKTKATCQTPGIKERSCHNCHITESEKTKTTNHKESDWIIDKVAEIGKDGLKYTKCVYCNKRIEEKVIPAIAENHQHAVAEWVTIKTPTCTASGTQNAICSCGKIIKTKETPSNGHSLIVDKAVAATCTSNGLTEGSHCSVCKTTIVKQNIINKLPHIPVTDAAVSATCKDTGMSEGSHCSVCKMVLVEQTVIPKTNTHTLSSWIVETEATCKAVGKKYRKCIDCNKKLETATIEKLTTHRVGVMNVEIDEGLFCGDKGEYFSTVYCKDCGEKISEANRALPEKHSMKNGVCEICGLPQSTTTGLYFGLNPDGKSYYVMPNAKFTGGNVVIGVYNGLSVTEVDGFAHCEGLKTIVIGDCVKNIGVFEGCSSLIKAVIGNGIKEIPAWAFRHCTSLSAVTIGDNVIKIGENAFSGCNNLYYAYISGAHDWMHWGNKIYGNWIGKEYGMESYFANYLKKYTFEWYRQ